MTATSRRKARRLRETNKNLDAVVKVLKEEQKRTGIKLLWGTANLFSNPRFVHGAATSCNADVFAFAAAQVKKALEVTHELGGAGYVFWGGREGYSTLVEHQHEARAGAPRQIPAHGGGLQKEDRLQRPVLHRAEAEGTDQASIRFRRRRVPEFPARIRSDGDFKLNIETNHATLAGHTMQHELEVAGAAGALGSIDANTGDELIGWDTDQFPTSIYLTTQIMLTILKYGGFNTGGLNFDAKVRRESFEPVDLFHAHIGGMDAFARGLKIAAAIRKDGRLAEFVKERYASWDSGIGAKIESGKSQLQRTGSLHAQERRSRPRNVSGRQEFLENLINEFI